VNFLIFLTILESTGESYYKPLNSHGRLIRAEANGDLDLNMETTSMLVSCGSPGELPSNNIVSLHNSEPRSQAYFDVE
jgi:hypothetical protein